MIGVFHKGCDNKYRSGLKLKLFGNGTTSDDEVGTENIIIEKNGN
jgi:hypothetical protein